MRGAGVAGAALDGSVARTVWRERAKVRITDSAAAREGDVVRRMDRYKAAETRTVRAVPDERAPPARGDLGKAHFDLDLAYREIALGSIDLAPKRLEYEALFAMGVCELATPPGEVAHGQTAIAEDTACGIPCAART